jgi:hypothetical protein
MSAASRLVLATLAVAVVSCSDPLGPLVDGNAYHLARINGENTPWTSPLGGQITGGLIKLDNDTLAERGEDLANGPAIGGWGLSGRYTLRLGMLIIDYRPNWSPGFGPLHPVDTFYVSGNGLVLRETGFVAPLDTIVRNYARP